MTKHPDEFLQFTHSVTCREYILPRDQKSTDPKAWIRGNTKIGPVFEVATSYLQGNWSWDQNYVLKQRQFPLVGQVRNSHGLNKLVTDLIDKEYDDNEQETFETKTEVFSLKTEVFTFASWSTDKATPRRLSTISSSTRTVLVGATMWIHIVSGAQADQAYPVARRLNILLRHGQITSRRRWSDWILETERWSSEHIWVLSTLVWRYVEEQDGRRRSQREKVSILY